MAGAVKYAKLDSPTARGKLDKGRQPHWESLVPGKVHLGYQRWRGDADGRWLMRRYIGSHKNSNGNIVAKYRSTTLGRADDARDADGVGVLNYEQAKAAANAMVGTPTGGGKIVNLTVRQAMERYIERKRVEGKAVNDLTSKNNVYILPELGDLVVAELTDERLSLWLATIAASAPQTRPKNGQLRYRAKPVTEEDKSHRRATANRALVVLKAGLNYAFDKKIGHINNRDAWDRKLKPLEDAGVARNRYFSFDEVRRLLNAAAPDFRPLLRAAVETGCRYGELTRLQVKDFNPDAGGTVAVRQSKSGKPRSVVLTDEGAEFFRNHCAGRPSNALMFTRANGAPWKATEQARPMRETCHNARVEPAAGFHQLRHTWASHAVMNGMPLLVVARNLGHKDTLMVERHYGHLTKDYITEAIRAGAPVYGIKEDQRVRPLRPGSRRLS